MGIPDNTPMLLNVIPGGRFPDDTVQIYGCVPPTAVSCWTKITPTDAEDSDVVVIFKCDFGDAVSDTVGVAEPQPINNTERIKGNLFMGAILSPTLDLCQALFHTISKLGGFVVRKSKQAGSKCDTIR